MENGLSHHMLLEELLHSRDASFEDFAENRIAMLDAYDQACALSFLLLNGKIPSDYYYPVSAPDTLLYLASNTPAGIKFRTPPRLLANQNISGMNLNRLSDFDLGLLDAASSKRVNPNISRTVITKGADLREISMKGLHAKKADFSGAIMRAEQLLEIEEITGMKIPESMPLKSLNGKMLLLAPALMSMSLSDANLEGCDLSGTDYPLEKLLSHRELRGVIFPEANWQPYKFSEDGTFEGVAYSMDGCTFINCDMRNVYGLKPAHAEGAMFVNCALPNGIRNMQDSRPAESEHSHIRERSLHHF